MKRIIAIVFLVIIVKSYAQETKYPFALMPWPKEIKTDQGMFIINDKFKVNLPKQSSDRVRKASVSFIRQLTNRSGIFIDQGFPVSDNNASLLINYKKEGKLNLFEDESYNLEVSENLINIDASTDIGVLRAFETLLQLLSHNEKNFFFPVVKITDAPRFPWRGLMIDVARHFQPLDVLKRNLDAMASVKLNVFHWHLTDDQGFRMESKLHPKLHQLGSDGQYYSQEQIKEIIQYASNLGIRVIPEIDIPGHATAILTAYPEIGSKNMEYTIERYAGIFDPTLDPTNELTYQILDDIFKEVATLFPDEYIHIGGDENEGKHWDDNPKIVAFKKAKGFTTNHELQNYFNIRVQKIIASYNKKILGWEEIISPDMDKSAIIYSWKGVNEGVEAGYALKKATELGYHAILSNGYYLDLMLPLEGHYLTDPVSQVGDLDENQKNKILGGEAAMWGELVTPLTIDSRIWPRMAAIAERFWSSEEIKDIHWMKERLNKVSLKLEHYGLTHLKNKDVILRNIAKSDYIKPLEELSNVCEPLKKYTRNKGGTEYKSFSPFTLFADVCTNNAIDAENFEDLVNQLKGDISSDRELLIDIERYLKRWSLLIKGVEAYQNPNAKRLVPLVKNLYIMSSILLEMSKGNKLSELEKKELQRTFKSATIPVEDVELVIVSGLENYYAYLQKHKFKNSNAGKLSN